MREADEPGVQGSRGRASDALRQRFARLIAQLRSPVATAHGSALVTSGNAIGFLRFFLAGLVVVHHTRVLGGFGSDPFLRLTHRQADLGLIAVAGFFTLSGFLITRSAEHVSLPRYLWHRLVRIMPAFWICLIVIVVVVGPLLWLSQYGSLDGYLGASPSPADYVTQNAALVINQVRIDGLLKDNPYPYGLNGSLWTLAYEFAWYLVVAILAGLRILRPGIVALLLLLVLAEAAIGWRPLDGVPVVGYALGSRFGISFVVGMLAYLLRDRLPLDDRLAVVAGGHHGRHATRRWFRLARHARLRLLHPLGGLAHPAPSLRHAPRRLVRAVHLCVPDAADARALRVRAAVPVVSGRELRPPPCRWRGQAISSSRCRRCAARASSRRRRCCASFAIADALV